MPQPDERDQQIQVLLQAANERLELITQLDAQLKQAHAELDRLRARAEHAEWLVGVSVTLAGQLVSSPSR